MEPPSAVFGFWQRCLFGKNSAENLRGYLHRQFVASAVVDQFGLFGMAKRPIDIVKLTGLAAIAVGIAVMEIGNLTKARP